MPVTKAARKSVKPLSPATVATAAAPTSRGSDATPSAMPMSVRACVSLRVVVQPPPPLLLPVGFRRQRFGGVYWGTALAAWRPAVFP